MRMKFLGGAAVSVLLLASPAFSDVTVTGEIDVDKDINIDETVTIDNDITLDVDVELNATKFAESRAIANQTIDGNTACSNCAEKTDLIENSSNGNTGISSINQASGNFNNQGTLISAAVDAIGTLPPPPAEGEDPVPLGGFAHSTASADQRNGSTEALGGPDSDFEGDGNTVKTVNILFRGATVTDSFNANTGLIFGNQSAGNMNNQANVLSLAFSLADNGVALSEADLGQVNANNTVGEASLAGEGNGLGINKTASITNSLNGNTGVVGVNQSVGNLANQANIVSIAAVGSALPTF